MILIPRHTPNVSARTRPVTCIVVHATAGSIGGALAWLTNPASRVSADFVIAKNGDVYQLNPALDVYYTWHAGKSAWRGLEIRNTLNPVSIGIELENRNTGVDPYPPEQLASLTLLVRDRRTRYGVDMANIVRHVDVSPGRKTDPKGMDWEAWKAAL